VDGYVYNAAEEPQILMTGKWNGSMSYQPCDMEGEPLAGTEMKEVSVVLSFCNFLIRNFYWLLYTLAVPMYDKLFTWVLFIFGVRP
jgi:hypothetical protein